MNRARFASSFLCAAVLASGASGVQMLAQLPANATVYASGLEGPRGWPSDRMAPCMWRRPGLAGPPRLSAPASRRPRRLALQGRADRTYLEDRHQRKCNDPDLGAAFGSEWYGGCFRCRGRSVSGRGSVCGPGWGRMFAWKHRLPERSDQGKREDWELDERGEYEPGIVDLPGEVHELGRL